MKLTDNSQSQGKSYLKLSVDIRTPNNIWQFRDFLSCVDG